MESSKYLKIGPKADTCQEDGDGAINRNTTNTDKTAQEERLFLQVLGVPLILKEILKCLPFHELLKTSLVSQSWNFFSREILREKNCFAIIDSGNSCDSLKRFNQLLKNTENVPFSGLSINVSFFEEDEEKRHQCVQYDNLSELSCHIISKICVKYLQIDYDERDSCVAIDFIRKILRERAETLEEFSVDAIPSEVDNWTTCLGLKLTGTWLPKVRILEIESAANLYAWSESETLPCSMIEEIVQATPNLREIRGYIHPYYLGILLKRKLTPAIKEFHYVPSRKNGVTEEWVRQFALSNPALKKFSFSTQINEFWKEIQDFSLWSKADQDQVAQNVIQILQSSKNSLHSLQVDQLGLVLMISQWNIPVLEKVIYLNLWYSPQFEKDWNVPMLSKLDWSKHFPNLKHVCVTNHLFEPDDHTEFYFNECFRLSTTQFCCKTVIEFTQEGYHEVSWNPDELVDLRQMQIFANIFPNVLGFSTPRTKQFSELMPLLLVLWPDLQILNISVYTEIPFNNFDSIMTGLFAAETGFIYENFEDAKSLEIVPVKPCLLNLKNLRFLTFKLYHPKRSCENSRITSDLVFLSRVSAQCAFTRMPKLAVSFERETCKEKTNCNLALHHLKPFAKVIDLIS